MDMENVKKGGRSKTETVQMGSRVTPETREYIKANNISLRKLIEAAIEELKQKTQ